jgi:hypothetical protein
MEKERDTAEPNGHLEQFEERRTRVVAVAGLPEETIAAMMKADLSHLPESRSGYAVDAPDFT